MDSSDGVFVKEHSVNTAKGKVMLQIGLHPLQIGALEMTFRNDPGSKGPAIAIGELIDKIVLPGQYDRQPGL